LISDSGAQPLTNEDGTLVLAVNGEIYNHRVLRKQLKQPYNFKTHSDCEVIIPLVSDRSELELHPKINVLMAM
jgi:asparagine synthase (glutamine-hydrolysing)